MEVQLIDSTDYGPIATLIQLNCENEWFNNIRHHRQRSVSIKFVMTKLVNYVDFIGSFSDTSLQKMSPCRFRALENSSKVG